MLLRAVGIQAKEGAARMHISIHTYRAYLRNGMQLVKFGNPQSYEEFEQLLAKRNGILALLVVHNSAKKPVHQKRVAQTG